MPHHEDAGRMYDQIANDYATYLKKEPPDGPLTELLRRLQPSGQVLDIGCASGRDTQFIYDHGFRASGVDTSSKLLAIARAEHPDVRFIQADMTDLPFKAGAIDGIWANAVIHHLPHSAMPGALSEWARVLKPGGVLYVHTKQGTGTLYDNAYGIERWFSLLEPDTLEHMLEAAGFGLIKMKTRRSESRDLNWLNASAVKL